MWILIMIHTSKYFRHGQICIWNKINVEYNVEYAEQFWK